MFTWLGLFCLLGISAMSFAYCFELCPITGKGPSPKKLKRINTRYYIGLFTLYIAAIFFFCVAPRLWG